VLGNSLGTDGRLWSPQLPALTERFRVVRYDHPGHDGTPWTGGERTVADLGADVIELLDHLGVASASLAGISLGGIVALWVAANAPERVDRLALCCTTAGFPPSDVWADRIAAVRASGTGILVDGLMERWFTPGFTDAQDLVTGMLTGVDREGYAVATGAVAGADLHGDLGRVRAPTLVLAGREDPVTPPSMALALHEGIEGSSLVVLPGAAHLANLERPGTFTRALVEHLAGPPLERGLAVRRAVLGDDHVDRAVAATTPFTAGFQDLITRYAWGEIWTRPGLDRGRRSCVTLAVLVALGRFDELGMHVRAARRNGLSAEEIGEVLLQTAIYCGVPAARSAFEVAGHVLDVMEQEEPDGR
jgi:3-oxoadipate enol-lactonase/4-carboxymuconolactone decarboxylase